jgi:integrase
MSKVQRARKAKQEWPYIRFSQRENAWKVDARTKDGGSRKFFATKTEAETFAQQCRIQRKNSGTTSFGNNELAEYGWSVHKAIDFALAHLRAQKKSVGVAVAVDQLINSRKAAKRSARYCNDLRLRLGRFAKDFGTETVAAVDAEKIEEWLSSLEVAPGTRNTFRRDLRTLYSFSAKRGYCQSNEAAKTELATDVDKPAAILTVAQAAALLSACEGATLAYTAISLFAGLRASEVQKLDWVEIDFESGHIEVTAAKSKTAKRRLVPIADNLREWLTPLAKVSGPVAPTALRDRLDESRRVAGFGKPGSESEEEKKAGVKLSEWPQNAMRHSFGSYRLAKCEDAARVSLEMGNSQQMVFAHYRELVKPKAAEQYWQLKPGNDADRSKVVSFV